MLILPSAPRGRNRHGRRWLLLNSLSAGRIEAMVALIWGHEERRVKLYHSPLFVFTVTGFTQRRKGRRKDAKNLLSDFACSFAPLREIYLRGSPALTCQCRCFES